MPRIRVNQQVLSCERNETVLDALLAVGMEYPFSCKTGQCQVCMARCVRGMVPEAARKGLSPERQQQGYFLACQCRPESDMQIVRPSDAAVFGRAVVVEKKLLAAEICQLILEPATPLYYHPGQFVNLRRQDGLERSYALASIPRQTHLLELHIQLKRGGQFSQWVFDEVQAGYGLDFQGPNGDCYYQSEDQTKDILLIAEDVGLAALIGVIRDALNSDHHGGLYLYHGSRSFGNLYLQQEIRQLQYDYEQFNYIPCLQGDGPAGYALPGVIRGRAEEISMDYSGNLNGWKVYLAGTPGFVEALRIRAQAVGAAAEDIREHIFAYRNLRQRERDTASCSQVRS